MKLTEDLRRCPSCGASLRSDQLICSIDGTYVEPAPGAQIFEKYEYLETIGQGGMGIVFKAKQMLMDNIVAIKVLQSNITSPKAIRRFQEEARTTVRLSHQNIVATRDFGLSREGCPFMVMDYIGGTTLKGALETLTYIPEPLLIVILKQVCDALSYTHNQGVCHRDIKPANIMLSSMDPNTVSVKIMDFGIAKRSADGAETPALTQTGETLGSPYYMSPEQISGATVDSRSDLYSLGCVVFECLTGVPPFQAETAIATCSKHLTDTPQSLREASLGQKYSNNWEIFTASLLKKKPEERVPSAVEARRLLSLIQRNEDISVSIKLGKSGPSAQNARTTGTTSKLSKESAVALAASCTLFLATVMTAGLAIFGSAENDAKSRKILDEQTHSLEKKDDLYVNDNLVERGAPESDLLTGMETRWDPTDNSVDFHGGWAQEAALLQLLKKHPEIRRLNLNSNTVSLNVFDALPATEIVVLELENSSIDEPGLERLKKCKNLKQLNLNNTTFHVTSTKTGQAPSYDEALILLADSKIQLLKLQSWDITEFGFQQLVKMPELVFLNVSSTPFNPKDAAFLMKAPKLHTIVAHDCAAIDRTTEENFVRKYYPKFLETKRNHNFVNMMSQYQYRVDRKEYDAALEQNILACFEMKKLGPPYTELYGGLVTRQLKLAEDLIDQHPGKALRAAEVAVKTGTAEDACKAEVIMTKAHLKEGELEAAKKDADNARAVLRDHPEIKAKEARAFLSHLPK